MTLDNHVNAMVPYVKIVSTYSIFRMWFSGAVLNAISLAEVFGDLDDWSDQLRLPRLS